MNEGLGELRVSQTLFYIEHTVILQEFDKYMKENGKTSPLDKAINGEEIRNEKIPKWFKKRKYF